MLTVSVVTFLPPRDGHIAKSMEKFCRRERPFDPEIAAHEGREEVVLPRQYGGD